ncbi:type II toxin-antitoxin system RelE/ParE family toxin [Salmonella enterica]|nr:type II toxin-antitoxin system RelE/ParE family toxin [Salmonella enterica]EGG4259892.1 type II toxin-antitoxin system RelE/ParE family toxin [Salmonella enterica]EGG4287178.1 type II toxin-antitoxin system RelE/ParE family toxin [Salmonella enterica]
MYNIIWRNAAKVDRESIFSYIAQDDPVAAVDLDAEFDVKVEMAARQPEMYRYGRVQGSREIVVRHSYIMIYRIDDEREAIVVLRLLHVAQKWPR